QGPAEARGEPGDGMETARAVPRRGDPVQHHEGTALPGGGQADTREVLVGAARVPRLRNQLSTHPASLHEPFTTAAKWRRSTPDPHADAGQVPGLGRNAALWKRVAANIATARRRRPTGVPTAAPVHGRGTCPPTPVRCSLLRVAGQVMLFPCPFPLGGSGRWGRLAARVEWTARGRRGHAR